MTPGADRGRVGATWGLIYGLGGEPMTERSREELAWAAGIFDGEGYIGTVERKVPSHGRRVPRLEMRVSQYHDPEVIDRFAAALGVGRVRHRVIKRDGASEWLWASWGFEPVQASVAMLWPWLSGPKRRQAARALESYHGRRAVIGVREWRRRRGGQP